MEVAGVSLYDILIMIVCFKIVSPWVRGLKIFNTSTFGQYVAAVATLVVVPFLFNQRTPSVSHFFDSKDHWILKLLTLGLLAKVVVEQPRPVLFANTLLGGVIQNDDVDVDVAADK